MEEHRMSLAEFLDRALEEGAADADLATIVADVGAACVEIAEALAQGALVPGEPLAPTINVQGEEQKLLDFVANRILLERCAGHGVCAGMLSEELADPVWVSGAKRDGAYLLAFDPLDGSSNVEVNGTVGTIFSILRAPAGHEGAHADFLQPGADQVCAGYALYGPASMLVLTLGQGVQGFTFDLAQRTFVLTHRDLRMPQTAEMFAINASNERFWQPPVKRYVEECVAGRNGPRGRDFNMRWSAAFVVEVHRILMRGGVYLYPYDARDPSRPGRLRLLYEASPMAMLIEQAGGRASTGRQRLLDLVPSSLHERVPVLLGSSEEVARLERYHAEHDQGEDQPFSSPLFNMRSLYRGALA